MASGNRRRLCRHRPEPIRQPDAAEAARTGPTTGSGARGRGGGDSAVSGPARNVTGDSGAGTHAESLGTPLRGRSCGGKHATGGAWTPPSLRISVAGALHRIRRVDTPRFPPDAAISGVDVRTVSRGGYWRSVAGGVGSGQHGCRSAGKGLPACWPRGRSSRPARADVRTMTMPPGPVRRRGRRDGPRADAPSSRPRWHRDARRALRPSARQILDGGVLQGQLRLIRRKLQSA